ncbi:MAG: translation initiation factor IF-3 [Puniceicoccales bacterium]|jgi:translation initiation factor IF-3|nr:translation initiation factor IF-3 [Puniceicoccales bacterium]
MANIRSKSNNSKWQKNTKTFVRCNDKIRAPEVRLIGVNGNMLGVVPIEEARAEARRSGFDLIEISPHAVPPVCRISDFGKYQYEVTKKQRDSKSNSSKIKEMKFRFCTDTHDYETKMRHMIEFLCEGDKVKASVFFRGRELSQTQLGFDLIKKLTLDLAEYATVDGEAKLVGRNIVATYSPAKKAKQKQRIKDSPEELQNTVL